MDGDNPAGDARGADALLPLAYDELRRLAAAFFRDQRPGQTLQPTALVHEAYVRLAAQSQGAFVGREHFLATAARAMRQILVDHSRRRGAQKRGGEAERVVLQDDHGAFARDVDLLELNDAIDRLAGFDERKARVVEMRLFAGLSLEEVALALHVSRVTVSSDWRMASAWLATELSP